MLWSRLETVGQLGFHGFWVLVRLDETLLPDLLAQDGSGVETVCSPRVEGLAEAEEVMAARTC